MKLIAEIGAANGSVDYAIRAAEAAAAAGCWAVKGQMYRRETLTTRGAATYAVGLEDLPTTQWEDFERTIKYEDWADVKDACDDLDIECFFSVFDFDAVDECEAMSVNYYKVASGDITFEQLIRTVGETGKHVFLSTGASTRPEVGRALSWVGHGRVTPMVCTLAYPTPDDQAHLARIPYWLKNYGPVGWSDHTRGMAAVQVAFELGAAVVEKHFTITPGQGGDHDFAVTPLDVFKWHDSGIDVPEGQRARLMGSYYITPRTIEQKAHTGARRSLCAAVDIEEGEVVTADKITFLRPGTGVEPFRLHEVAGTVAGRFYPAGTQLERTT